MATPLSSLITNARTTLLETSANFWTDAELLTYAIDGCRQLWKKIIDLNQGHFQTVDDTNVTMAVGATALTGVPTDVFRVESLELRDVTTQGTTQGTTFTPKKKNTPEWQSARSMGTVDPGGREFLFDIRNAGSPVVAPAIDIVPKPSAAVDLRLVYTHTLGTLTSSSDNPIPGESDHAVQAWIVAHARAKEREDRGPDPQWMGVFGIDEANLLVALTPRQVQEPDVAEALFEAYW